MTAPDYRPTVFLPKTDFPMKAALNKREAEFLSFWEEADIYAKVLEKNAV
jgi:isoleucyl-tRNA synthetase